MAGARRRKSATAVTWRSIGGAIAEAPAVKVTGSTFSSSILSSLPLNSRPIALKGADTTLTTTLRTTVQMASPRFACQLSTGPAIGRLTFKLLSPSVMRATMSPSGRPTRFLTSSSCRVGATWMFCTKISFGGVELAALDLVAELHAQLAAVDDPGHEAVGVGVHAGEREVAQLAADVGVEVARAARSRP